jgi:hypothetical protein
MSVIFETVVLRRTAFANTMLAGGRQHERAAV